MFKFIGILVCGMAIITEQAFAVETIELKSEKDKLSYSIGLSIGKNLKREGTDFDPDLLIKGFRSAIAGEKPLMPEKEWRKILNVYQTELRQHAILAKQTALDSNKKKGDAFLAANKNKEGVVVLPSGVQYKVLVEGKGKKPQPSDVVVVNYRGTLIDGTEFDATEPGHPANLKIAALIAGWKEALSLMPTGSKWQIVIPPQLAYSDKGVGTEIEPNSTLVFEVELIAIQ